MKSIHSEEENRIRKMENLVKIRGKETVFGYVTEAYKHTRGKCTRLSERETFVIYIYYITLDITEHELLCLEHKKGFMKYISCVYVAHIL